jgi:predicted N-acetyltransferase YhbS
VLVFVPLEDRAALIDEVAAAHVQAFGELLPDWTATQAADELRTPSGSDGLPRTWLACEDGQWLGSVSLLQEDHAQLPQYSPWLASLYVRAEARGQGIGQALVAHAITQAAALGVATLYLYCAPAMHDYYRQQGWHVEGKLQLGPLAVVVMYVVPAVHTAPHLS